MKILLDPEKTYRVSAICEKCECLIGKDIDISTFWMGESLQGLINSCHHCNTIQRRLNSLLLFYSFTEKSTVLFLRSGVIESDIIEAAYEDLPDCEDKKLIKLLEGDDITIKFLKELLIRKKIKDSIITVKDFGGKEYYSDNVIYLNLFELSLKQSTS